MPVVDGKVDGDPGPCMLSTSCSMPAPLVPGVGNRISVSPREA